MTEGPDPVMTATALFLKAMAILEQQDLSPEMRTLRAMRITLQQVTNDQRFFRDYLRDEPIDPEIRLSRLGFSPGRTVCRCHDCHTSYRGDQRSFRCRRCANLAALAYYGTARTDIEAAALKQEQARLRSHKL